jgi:hypothetical protein
MAMPMKHVVIDACSAINLLATERAVDFLRALDWTLFILPEEGQPTSQMSMHAP